MTTDSAQSDQIIERMTARVFATFVLGLDEVPDDVELIDQLTRRLLAAEARPVQCAARIRPVPGPDPAAPAPGPPDPPEPTAGLWGRLTARLRGRP